MCSRDICQAMDCHVSVRPGARNIWKEKPLIEQLTQMLCVSVAYHRGRSSLRPTGLTGGPF